MNALQKVFNEAYVPQDITHDSKKTFDRKDSGHTNYLHFTNDELDPKKDRS
jgi:hypothetical protein